MKLKKPNENKIIKIILIISLLTNNIENDNCLYKNSFKYKKIKANSSILKIFIMTHKDFDNERYNPVYNIVADDKSQLKNNYSLNVIYADKGKLYNLRKAYGEMSKLYFIYQLYKNETISSEYIGLNHYRRYFIFGDNIPYLEDIFKKYDVILNRQIIMNIQTRKQYCMAHNCNDFDDILNIIKDIKPEYYQTAKRTSKEKKLYLGNLFIMKKEDFFKYCEFVYDILFEFDKRKNFTSDSDVINYTKKIFYNSEVYDMQSRLQGFLAERISNIFFKQYFKKVKIYDIEK